MGNTPSSNSNPNSPNPNAGAGSSSTPPLNAAGGATSTLPRSASTPVPSSTGSSLPVPTSIPAGPSAAAAAAAAAGERSIFHSGLTPPVSPPSPPPPSTPPLLPHAGHLSPQNPHALSHPQAHDFSKSTVTRLILEAKLAPFYRGLEDFEDDWTLDDIGRTLDEVREKDVADGVANSVSERIKEERANPGAVGSVAKKIGIHKSREAREREERMAVYEREKQAYLNATECPICFLPICTECFVQIKRSEATLTHLESEPACCPFCVETDFGVIYERPPTPVSTQLGISPSAIASSPDKGGASGFSQALSIGSEEAELSVGPGMAPKIQETIRRKSVNAKDKQVVTIDEIRPDWEAKLNAVKAAAARKASRRIVMRQVGDRLIPIGYTSSRAPGTADFSMSVGNNENGSRRRRTGSGRERDLEELMIMEAMRLSMIDHEDHQKKMSQEAKGGASGAAGGQSSSASAAGTIGTGAASGSAGASGSGTPQPTEFGAGGLANAVIITGNAGPSASAGGGGTGGSSFRKRAGTEGSSSSGKDKSASAASKLLSKFGGRSRSGSSASKLGGGSSKGGERGEVEHRVSFAESTRRGSGTGSGASSSTNVTSPSQAQGQQSSGLASSKVASSPISPISPTSPTSPISPVTNTDETQLVDTAAPAPAPISAPKSTTAVAPIGPAAASPAGPVTTRADASAPISATAAGEASGLPRISLDMPPLAPDHAPTTSSK